MIPRHAFAITCTLLLLGSTTIPVLAHDGFPTKVTHPTGTHRSPMNVVSSYFAALNNRGVTGHAERPLVPLYAAQVVLIESVSTGRPQVHTGIRQALAFDHSNQLRFALERVEQLSPTVVLTLEHPSVQGPGYEGGGAALWLTVFTVKGGKIVNLTWLPC
jgi:hypothetical protein